MNNNKKNIILEINNVDVNQCDIGKLENISIKVYEKDIVSVVCDKNDQVLLSLIILGKTKRLKGEAFINNAIIPSYPLVIFKKLRNRIHHYVKFIDLETRSLLVSQMKVKKSLIKTLKKDDHYKWLKKQNKAKLHKDLLIEFAKLVKDKDLQLSIITNANKKEKVFYAKRNITHYKQLLHINILTIFEEWIKIEVLKKEWKGIKKRVYRSIARGESLEYMSSSSLEYKKKLKQLFEEYQQKSITNKKERKILKEFYKKERINLIDSYFSFRTLRKKLKQYVKQQQFKKGIKSQIKFKFINKCLIDAVNDSIYEVLKKRILNVVYKSHQLNDYFFHKSICKEYKPLFKYDKTYFSFFKKKLQEYTLNNSYNAHQICYKNSINKLIDELNIEKSLLNEKVNSLSKGEQFDLLLLNSLLTNPKFLIISDNQNIDNTIKKRKLEKLLIIKKNHDLTILFLTSDISIATKISNFCYIIKTKMIECGTTNDILTQPIHAYTRNLLFSQLSYSVNSLESFSPLFTSKTKSIIHEPYKVSPTHYVYESPSLVNYWLTTAPQFEMDYIQRHSLSQTKIFIAKE